jgi:hypothetical protein
VSWGVRAGGSRVRKSGMRARVLGGGGIEAFRYERAIGNASTVSHSIRIHVVTKRSVIFLTSI